MIVTDSWKKPFFRILSDAFLRHKICVGALVKLFAVYSGAKTVAKRTVVRVRASPKGPSRISASEEF